MNNCCVDFVDKATRPPVAAFQDPGEPRTACQSSRVALSTTKIDAANQANPTHITEIASRFQTAALKSSNRVTYSGQIRSKDKDNSGLSMSLTNAFPGDAADAAKSASHILATLPTGARNDALTAIHSALSKSKDEILAANARDLELARRAAENGELSLSIVSRLDLGKKGKWEDMLRGILDVRDLEDPGMLGCLPPYNPH